MFATSTKTATFLPTVTPWVQLAARPARTRSTAATFIRRDARQRLPRSRFVVVAVRRRRSPSSGGGSDPRDRRAASPRRRYSPCCWPIGAAPRRAASVITVGVVVGIDDQEVDASRRSRRLAPTVEGRGRAPPTIERCDSATTMLACGRYTSWRMRSAASSGLSLPDRRASSARATSRSMSVTRAARTRYSTPNAYLAGFDVRSPSTGARP